MEQQATHRSLIMRINACFCNHWVLSDALQGVIMALFDEDSRLSKSLCKFFLRTHTLNWYLCPLESLASRVLPWTPVGLGRREWWLGKKILRKVKNKCPALETCWCTHLKLQSLGHYFQVFAIFNTNQTIAVKYICGWFPNLIEQGLCILVLYL